MISYEEQIRSVHSHDCYCLSTWASRGETDLSYRHRSSLSTSPSSRFTRHLPSSLSISSLSPSSPR